MQITLTLTVEQLLEMPSDSIIRIIDQANPPREFLTACIDHEWRALHGKGRWPVTNHIRTKLAALPSS